MLSNRILWNGLSHLRTCNVMCCQQWKLPYHCHDTQLDHAVPQEWYRVAYAKLLKLSYALKNVKHIDGKLMNCDDKSIINDTLISEQMQCFNSLARALTRAPPSPHHGHKKPLVGNFFNSQNEMRPLTVDSITKICNFLGISAQKRRNVRLIICPQVTQHHIWRGALKKILENLKHEVDDCIGFHSTAFQMGNQIIVSCLKFLEDTAGLQESETPAWIRLAASKNAEKTKTPPRKWEEVLEMFVHLTQYVSEEERLLCDIEQVEVMKEGLYQIRDIVIDKDTITFKEARRHDLLVQKKLTKSLGHSSKCLFTLLLYYLYGTVRHMEVEVCEGICAIGKKSYLHIGKFITSDDEEVVRNVIKQLYRALGVFKFVWEAASMDGTINLKGHLWSVGANERALTYRGVDFFVHDITLRYTEEV